MTNELHDLAAAYALDAVDAEERSAFEAHLATCAECQIDVAELSDGASFLAEEAAPPAAMRDRVLDAAATTTQDVVTGSAQTDQPQRSMWWWVGSVAAAFVLVVGGIAAFNTLTDSRPTLSDIQAAPDAAVIDLEGSSDAIARFVYSVDEGRGFFVASGLESLAADETYELWLIDATRANPAGLFVPMEGLAMVAMDGDLGNTINIALTVEPEGGSPVPTGDVVLIGTLD